MKECDGLNRSAFWQETRKHKIIYYVSMCYTDVWNNTEIKQQ